MHNNEKAILSIIEATTKSIGDALGSFNDRIRKLENDAGREVLKEIDLSRDDYKDGTLAQFRDSLWRYEADGESWNCVADSVHAVTAEPTATGFIVRIEQSSGIVTEHHLTLPSPLDVAA
jgi:hypothetical protein